MLKKFKTFEGKSIEFWHSLKFNYEIKEVLVELIDNGFQFSIESGTATNGEKDSLFIIEIERYAEFDSEEDEEYYHDCGEDMFKIGEISEYVLLLVDWLADKYKLIHKYEVLYSTHLFTKLESHLKNSVSFLQIHFYNDTRKEEVKNYATAALVELIDDKYNININDINENKIQLSISKNKFFKIGDVSEHIIVLVELLKELSAKCRLKFYDETNDDNNYWTTFIKSEIDEYLESETNEIQIFISI